MSITSLYTHYMVDLIDPRTKTWPLTNPLSVLSIITIYLYIVLKAGPNFMRHREPYNLKKVIQVYNILQVICCNLLIYRVLINDSTTHLFKFKCQPVDYSHNPTAIHLAETVWWTMMLKCAELIETVFYVFRKKFNQISVLHLYHHTSTFFLSWGATIYIAGGMVAIPLILNSFIHVIMYTYYFLSTLGPFWQKKLSKWKPRLTILQMIQFCIILAHAIIFWREDCDFPLLAVYVFVPNVLLVFYMFYDFYKKNYDIKRK